MESNTKIYLVKKKNYYFNLIKLYSFLKRHDLFSYSCMLYIYIIYVMPGNYIKSLGTGYNSINVIFRIKKLKRGIFMNLFFYKRKSVREGYEK